MYLAVWQSSWAEGRWLWNNLGLQQAHSPCHAVAFTSCRLGRIAFHPMGDHLGTASYDLTWRLWDIATGDCLLEQVHFLWQVGVLRCANKLAPCQKLSCTKPRRRLSGVAVKVIQCLAMRCRKVTPGLCIQ
jgi:WD40 repeat protein